jgi:hypothetical protein
MVTEITRHIYGGIWFRLVHDDRGDLGNYRIQILSPGLEQHLRSLGIKFDALNNLPSGCDPEKVFEGWVMSWPPLPEASQGNE